MKKLYFKKLIFLLFLPFLLFTSVSQAKNYYISAAGSNSNSGLSPAAAWQTIAKLNTSFSLIVAGDSILFKSGETFYGSIIVSKSGTSAKPIVISSYGTGAKPTITGLSAITGWVNLGGNIWEAPTTNVKPANNLVMRDGIIQQVGRYPNANAANGGYLSYTAATAKSITGPALSTATNWTGAEIAVRLFRWEIRRRKVTSHSGGMVSFETMTSIPKVNYGYFFQRDARTLDQDGEWFQNGTTNKLRMYFANNNPAAYSMQAATIDTLFYNYSRSYITVSNLSFYGSNKAAIMHNAGSGIVIKNCDANNSGEDAITTWFCTNVTVDGCTTNNSLASGIRVFAASTGAANLTVKNSTVNNTAMMAGMESSDINSSGNGINCRGGDNLLVLNNVIKNSGYNALAWHGNHVNIKYNLIDGFCSVRDDGGAIYTYETPGNKIVNGINRNIVSNIILNGIGAPKGADGIAESSVVGVYTDEGIRDVIIDSNTVSTVAGNGFHGNGNGNITIRNNTTFNTLVSTSFQRLADENPVRGIVIKKNIFYPYRFKHRNLAINLPTLITRHADILAMGQIDSNYYSLRTGKDTSSASITRYADGSNSIALNNDFSYLTGTAGIETNSLKVANTGTLEYNASNTPKVISFQGLSKKDVFGNVYSNSAIIPAWGSKVLIPNGVVVIPNLAPVANAGTSQVITLPLNAITLTGSGTDTEGPVSSYAWIKISGPSAGTIATANTAATAVNNLIQGVYQFQLTVTDNNGLTGKDTVQVTVNAAPNQAPKGNAGTDNTITLPTNTTTLAGSGTDTEGPVSSYAWIKISGPSPGTIATSNTAATAVNNLVQGVYQFQLTVTDNNGLTGKDTVQVTVNAAPNQAPKGNAGTDNTITLPTNTTTLAGSGTDTEGPVSSYAWIKISGPSPGTIGTANTAATAVNNLVQGVYQFQLTVTDNNGLTGKDTVQVTVNAAPNQAPKGNAGSDNTITLPTNTTTLTGSGTDTEGPVSSYAWIKISGPSPGTIGTANTAATAVNNLVQGVYQFQLTVTDNNGLTGKDTVQVTVNAAPNQAPKGNAGTDNTITLPTNTTTLAGSGTDTEGPVSSYAWIKISGPSTGTIATANTAATAVNNLVQGVYQFQLTVTDNNGLTGKDTVQVTVDAAPNQAPEASAGTDNVITLPTSTTTLTGIGTDMDGTIGSYTWVKISGPSSVILASANAASTEANSLAEGVYQFELTITDNNGATGRDTVQVTVHAAPNQVPVASAGADNVFRLPTNTLTLTGIGTDSDGTIGGYSWVKISGPSPGIIATAKTASTQVNSLVEGSYQFELTVTDNKGLTGKDTVQVIVEKANQAPLANAGSDNIITLPVNSTTFTGSGMDADGTINTYSWAKISGPSSGTITMAGAAITSITGLGEGEYHYELTVTDNEGAIGKDTMRVTVNTIPVKTPVAKAGPDKLIVLPLNITTLSGSGTVVGGTISSYTWTKISGPANSVIVTANASTTGLTNLVRGIYKYALTVKANDGAIGKDTIQVTVNQAPVANAGLDQLIILPANTTTLSGSGIDIGGSISSYTWTKISGALTGLILTTDSAATGLTNLVPGIYKYVLTVKDNDGTIGKDTVQVTVNQAPVAKAGLDKLIILPANTTTLSGTGTDIGGTVTSYTWLRISGPVAGIVAPDSAITGLTGLALGVYKFALIVKDNYGTIGRDTVQVTVNQAPVAKAGLDKLIILPVNTTTLSGAGTDVSGTISTYTWARISGPLAGMIITADSAITGLTGLASGVYKYVLTVKDNFGTIGKDTVQVTVNQAPVAKAGLDKLLVLPVNTTTLSGTGTDLGGTVSSYTWTKIFGPVTGLIVTADSATTVLTGLVPGVYNYVLTIKDNYGTIGRDTVQVTVNQAPVAKAGLDKLIILPVSTTTLSGTGTDVGGTVSSYAWARISGPLTGLIVSVDSAITGLTNLVPGVYKYVLTVTDNYGTIGKDTVQVIVNQAPVAKAGLDKLIISPVNSTTLSGTGTDLEGTVNSYTWTRISGPLTGLVVTPDSSTTGLTNMVPGVYKYVLTVTDNYGTIGKDTVQVIVNQAPVAKAGLDKLIILPINTTTLSGAGTDIGGMISGYAWTRISGPATGEIVTFDSAATRLINLVPGIYEYEFTITDNYGTIGKDTVQVIVNQAPAAAAGSDQLIILPANITTLSGTGTDIGGMVGSYKWTRLSGPLTGLILTADSPTTGLTDLVSGVYKYVLTVTDNYGTIGKDTVQVIVNQAPVATAGPDKLILSPANASTLSGGGTDIGGTISSYAWTKISGPDSGTVTTSNAAKTGLTGLVPGVYIYEFTVKDNYGTIGRDSVQVTVNQAPKSMAGLDKLIILPVNTTTLSGAGTDLGGTVSSYTWSKISGPLTGLILTADSATTGLSDLALGVYKYALTVKDNHGATGKDTVQVTVNQAPVAKAGLDKLIILPANTSTLSGAGTDAGGTISRYLWVKISGPDSGTIVAPNGATTGLINLVPGVYFCELTVEDNYGAIGKDTVQVTVNQAPRANAGPDQLIILPANNTILSGTGSDLDGTVNSYSWARISGPLTAVISTVDAAITGLANLAPGVYKYVLTVTDNYGTIGKDTVQVIVNQAPVAKAGPDRLILSPSSTSTLTGSGTDVGGTVISYAWVKISGPDSGTITMANAATARLIDLVPGVYLFELTVTDNYGTIGKDTAQVTVNKAPLAEAGSDQLLVIPANTTTLSGAGTDLGGMVSSYMWAKISGPSTGLILTADSATTGLANLVPGVYKYILTVKDNEGAIGKDTIQVIVNQAPLAKAGADKFIILPANTATLSGTGTDAGGTIGSYLWVKISGPDSGTITTPNTATTDLTDLVPGVYLFELTVEDNYGTIGKDSVVVTVSGGANRVMATKVETGKAIISKTPVLNAGSNEFKVYPNPVRDIANLDISSKGNAKVSVSVVNTSGTLVKYHQPANLNKNKTIKLDMSGLKNGYYIITVRFDDGQQLSTKVIKYGGIN